MIIADCWAFKQQCKFCTQSGGPESLNNSKAASSFQAALHNQLHAKQEPTSDA